jgi:hypothetical protein
MSTIFCAPKGRAEKLGAIRQRASMMPVRAKGRASACCHLTLRCRQRAGAVSPPPRAPTPRDRQCNKCSPEIGSWFSETLLKSHGTLGARLGEALHVKASPCTNKRMQQERSGAWWTATLAGTGAAVEVKTTPVSANASRPMPTR